MIMLTTLFRLARKNDTLLVFSCDCFSISNSNQQERVESCRQPAYFWIPHEFFFTMLLFSFFFYFVDSISPPHRKRKPIMFPTETRVIPLLSFLMGIYVYTRSRTQSSQKLHPAFDAFPAAGSTKLSTFRSMVEMCPPIQDTHSLRDVALWPLSTACSIWLKYRRNNDYRIGHL